MSQTGPDSAYKLFRYVKKRTPIIYWKEWMFTLHSALLLLDASK